MLKNPPAKQETACSADLGSIPGSTRSPEEGNGNALQYSCLGSLKDRGAKQAPSPLDRKESDMTEQECANTHTHTHTHTHTPVLRQSDKSST